MDVYARRRARLALLVENLSKGNISAFAREYGYSRAQISQYLSETYNGGRSIGERAARTIERKCGSQSGWLDEPMTDGEQELLDRPFSTAELRVLTGKSLPADLGLAAELAYLIRVPLKGLLVPRKDGSIEGFEARMTEDPMHLDFYVQSLDVFALQVKGSALRPRFKNGEYILIHDRRRPQPGDDVIANFADEHTAILQFLYARDGEITFGDVRDAGPSQSLDEEEVDSIKVIIGTLHSDTKLSPDRS